MTREPQPPRLVVWLLEALLPAESREAVIGDLVEKHVASNRGRVVRKLVFLREALAAIVTMQLAPDGVSAFTPFARESGLQSLLGDVRYAWRSLARAPLFAAIVVLTTAVGIGANAAVLGIIDTAFFRKLPVPEPERVVRIASRPITSRSRVAVGWNSFPDWQDLRTQVKGLDDLAAFAVADFKLGGDLGGMEIQGALVSGNYFDVMRVRPARGRFIAKDEEEPIGAHPVVVISNALWRGTLGADENVVGRRIEIGGGTFTIVGVAPAGFTGTQSEGRTDVWMPYTMELVATGKASLFGNRDARRAQLIGRLRHGSAIAEVQGSVDNAGRDLATRYPESNHTVAFTAAIQDRLVPIWQAPAALASMLLAFAMIAMLHMAACANVASLLLARAAARRREIGIRLCLGASRARIISQSLAESGLLALFGAVGALLVSQWLTGLITRMRFMAAMNAGFDARIVVITLVVAALTVLQFGLLPAITASQNDPIGVVRGATTTTASRSHARSSNILIVAQVAISLILIAQSAVLFGKFRRESGADPGHDVAHLVVARVTTPWDGLPVETRRTHWLTAADDVLGRIARAPGVVSAAIATSAPLFGGWVEDVTIPGFAYPPNAPKKESLRTVGPGYFATIGARMVEGREFDDRDRYDEAQMMSRRGFDVVVVNERMAKRYWPGESAIGKTIVFRKREARVVGVVRDMRDVVPRATVAVAYFPLLEWRGPGFVVLARASGDEAQAAALVYGAITPTKGIEPPSVRTLADMRSDVFQLSKVLGLALSICAALALILSAIGLFGAVSMWAAARRGEIGIRLALGGTRRHILQILMGDAGRLTLIGGLTGSALTFALVQFERASFGPTMKLDAVPVLSAAAIFAAVIAAAAFIPARRASQLPPAEVLRGGD